MYNNKVVAA